MTVNLIDGDVMVHLACESRRSKRIPVDPGGDPEQQYYVQMLEKPLEPNTPMGDRFLDHCWEIFNKHLDDVNEILFADRFKVAMKGNGNFRMDIYPAYKANRTKPESMSNPFVDLLRQRAIEAGLGEPAHGMEADDLLRMWSEEAIVNDEHYVISSIDKDLKCIPGTHYHLKKNERTEVTKEAATRFFYEQLLMGDSTDNIAGVPGVGPVKAKAFLADLNSEEEFQIKVQQVYMSGYGENWRDALVLNGRLVYLLKHMQDIFTIDGWPEVENDEELVISARAPKIIVPQDFSDFKKLYEGTDAAPIPTVGANWGKK